MNDLFIFLFLITPVAFVAGIVKPSIYHKILRREASRKQLSKYFGSLFLALFILVGATTPSSGQEGKKEAPEAVLSDSGPSSNEAGVSGEVLYSVVRVIDGDTIEVEINGQKEKLRLIGINTPETVDPRKPVECFGKEASRKASEVLLGKKIKLEADQSQGERDNYGRLLRYVFLEDSTNFNKLMISEGYAHEYTYNLPYKYQQEFKEAQRESREAKRGLWADNVCAAPATGPVGSSAEPVSSPAPASQPSLAPSSAPKAPAPSSAPASASGVVKKSSTGICHAPGTTYYDRTTNYTAYNSLDACVSSGGRMPKG